MAFFEEQKVGFGLVGGQLFVGSNGVTSDSVFGGGNISESRVRDFPCVPNAAVR